MYADFNAWLGELPHPIKIVVPGNHEFLLEGDDQAARRLSNATLLINRGVEACGLRIWGSPVTALYGGAFGLSSIPDRRRIYQQIPSGRTSWSLTGRHTGFWIVRIPVLRTLAAQFFGRG